MNRMRGRWRRVSECGDQQNLVNRAPVWPYSQLRLIPHRQARFTTLPSSTAVMSLPLCHKVSSVHYIHCVNLMNHENWHEGAEGKGEWGTVLREVNNLNVVNTEWKEVDTRLRVRDERARDSASFSCLCSLFPSQLFPFYSHCVVCVRSEHNHTVN